MSVLKLRSGGTIALTLVVDLLTVDQDDLEFVMSIVEKFRGYGSGDVVLVPVLVDEPEDEPEDEPDVPEPVERNSEPAGAEKASGAFACPDCERTFTRPQSLALHRKSHQIYRCTCNHLGTRHDEDGLCNLTGCDCAGWTPTGRR